MIPRDPMSPPVRRLEIGWKPHMRDARGEDLAHKIRTFLGLQVACVRTRDVYHIEAPLSDEEARRVLHEFVDPVSQRGALGRLEDEAFEVAVTVAYRPGVTDPVGRSALVAVEDTLGRRLGDGAAVYSSTLYLFTGLDATKAERVARELLANPLIHTVRIEPYEAWRHAEPDLSVPRVRLRAEPRVEAVELPDDDAALVELSRRRLLALSLEELRAIRSHFLEAGKDPRRRELGLGSHPTDVELECLAQTWSEHCKHKIFNATITYREPGRAPDTIRSLFRTYIQGATREVERRLRERGEPSWLVSVFHDNAGVVAFDERVHLVYKVETHNSPSALDPYGGAITGIVGVNRDPFGTGLGADLLVNVWGYCFASPFYEGALPRGLLHPRRVREGVHRGVADGGNQSGIPYGRGWELFDGRFLGKPLVFCGTVGALPVEVAGRPGHLKAARPGDRIVMVGGRIGADGIHGATFSSAALDESAPVQVVQIGDPITQKKMFDFLLEARALGLYNAITDNGAGGLSSSVGEMARDPGGARIDLARAPLKYAGLAPWEILLSESQERMTLAVPPGNVEAFLELARRREVEATVLGEFTDSGYFHVLYGERTVAYLPLAFLHEGLPEMKLEAHWQPPVFEEPQGPPPEDLSQVLLAMLGRLNLCSNEAQARHYDHEVKGLTIIKPWVGVEQDVPAEATVFLARHGSWRGFVLSEGVHPFYSDLDTAAAARAAVDEAVRRQLCAGARFDRIALLDNFCWPDPVPSASNPDGAYKLAQLVRACRGLHEAAVAYEAPLVSGKDSMKNDSLMGGTKISVPPTLLVSALGQMEDVRRAVTLDFKRAGDVIFLLGATREELGGSEYYRYLGERAGLAQPLGGVQPYVGRRVPDVRFEETRPLYRALARAHGEGLLRSAATPVRGGLALALARSAMAGALGAAVDLEACAHLETPRDDAALFSESCGRFVVTTAPEDAERFARLFEGLACCRMGEVRASGRLVVRRGARTLLDVEVAAMKRAFKATLRDV